MPKLPMTDDEQRVWEAAYAAAFVTSFDLARRSELHGGLGFGFDRAARMTAEEAIAIADVAVLRLREWRQREDDLAGRAIDNFHADRS